MKEKVIKSEKNSVGKRILKILIFLILLFPLFMMYYFLIGIILLPIFYKIYGAESGAWALVLIIGMTLSPILTIITSYKIIKKI